MSRYHYEGEIGSRVARWAETAPAMGIHGLHAAPRSPWQNARRTVHRIGIARADGGVRQIELRGVEEIEQWQFVFDCQIELYNPFNVPMFGPPILEASSPTFGQIRTSPLSYLPRTLQLGMRLDW